MTDSSVTQCPHCRTRFRVSPVQLAAARGAVRCGACLHVFNAEQYLIGATAAAPLAAQPDVREQPDKPQVDDDMELDLAGLEEELARLEQNEQQSANALPALPGAPELLAGHAPVTADAQPPAAGPADIPQPESPAAEAPAPVAPPLSAEPESAEADPAQDAQSATPATDELAGDAPHTGVSADETKPQEQELFDLSSEPLRLDWQAPGKPWGRWIAWSLLNLLAAGALAGQYVAYNFEELARQDRFRPWFEQFCPQLGCQLPAKVDTSLLKSSNLVVREHPQFSGALIVDAIIYNRAAFSQPFPLLKLSFADIQGQPLASRRFKPSEYLGGELAGKKDMPPQTPIHVSLDILDPGQQAVNYSLGFESPE
jgi:predicted Zn finger-like uncharacterized protein